MEKDACVEPKNGEAAVDQPKLAATAPYRYTKEELLEIKELPISNERPECLSEKYDSDGVWDPEKWHASLYPTSERSSPVEGFKKDYMDDRVPLKRRIPDPRERLKEDDLDVVLSPQRRSFGGGCQGNAAPHIRRPISPLENKENDTLRMGGTRRIGSGRIIAARAFEREARAEKEKERERDLKDKRFRRDFGDKRVFSERRRNDSYAEEEPEWFSGGPTSQSETIELIGFDDKILEDDKRKSKRSRKRTESLKEVVECNGGQPEEQDVGLQPTADQEVPHTDVLPEPSAGDFDFNEFFNLEKTMPGLASQQTADQAVVTLPDAQVPAQPQKNIFQELLGVRSGSPTQFGNLLSSAEAPVTSAPLRGLLHKGPSLPLFPQRAPSPEYFNSRLQPPAGFPVGPQPMLPEQFADIHRSISPGSAAQQQVTEMRFHAMRALSIPINQADLEALAFQQDLALHAHHQFQSGYKQPQDKSFRNRPQRLNRSPGPGSQPAGRNSPGSTVTSMLSPSFTPTSVIRKMYATKEKSKDEPSNRSETKDDSAAHSHDGSSSPNLYLEAVDGNVAQSGGVKTSSQTLSSKEQERLRPGSTGHHPPAMVPQGPSSSFPRPVYPVPLLSHVPMVRPPPQLHPVVQRMLAQGIQPQQLGPALVQAGMFPPHDLAQLQGLPPALLGQPLYPLSTTGHPLLPSRASTQMQLAAMQQQLQQQQRPIHPIVPGTQSQSQGPHRTNGSQRHGGSPPLGLAKWFGSDVLEQPLPSMPAKVISVDELEFRP
ncbi:eukaryotic translation initiation factor 4E transporter isoform X8 [Astatotilapia calliptera]|uniref:eukaryotic translation initiation factor 4E transporter isoform X8 n=1 Tax=Astatotilapia calliptera TaxID=8154 RepID=UPI000329B5FD|nr:eukaryotic translation initiation factor 4E transporter isoform X6 [Maylandia zebra]XP_026023204.1 eukaryotic translation initiation factor 4E transporter isoform X8 [Astatotilapia calliptera]